MIVLLPLEISWNEVGWNLLLQITAVGLAAVAVGRWALRERPAARHAVLACALGMVWLGPVWLVIGRLSGLPTVPLLPGPSERTAVSGQGAVAQAGTAIPEPAASDFAPRRSLPGSLAAAAWATGAIFLLVRLAHGWLAVRRLRRGARPVDRPDLEGVLEDVRAALRTEHLPPVLATDLACTPLTVGVRRPCVLLPERMVRELPTGEFRQVLAHECAHAMRRDPAVALLQRLTAALFWVHPLIHLLNRDLSRAREEVCDNHVLRLSDPVHYSRTLLRIAESLGDNRGTLSVALIPWRWSLEDRIRSILSKRRDNMTQANRWTAAVAAVGLGAVAMLAGCAGAAGGGHRVANATGSDRQADLSHAVKYELGDAGFRPGDSITITQVTGSSERLQVGGTYQVKGRYTLNSAEKASLSLYVTATEGSGRGPVDPGRTMAVNRGEGEFSLVMTMKHKGFPHVSFYPSGSGSGFGGVYFGQGESVLHKAEWLHENEAK